MSAGSPRIDVAYFKLFDNCNARCNMCDCWLRPRSSRDLAHYLDVLERVLAARPRSIRFTGGEPLLLRGLPALVATAAKSGARVSVISNGRILPGKVRQLAESGCNEIVLSLDGPRQAHDRIRNASRSFSSNSRDQPPSCSTSRPTTWTSNQPRHSRVAWKPTREPSSPSPTTAGSPAPSTAT